MEASAAVLFRGLDNIGISGTHLEDSVISGGGMVGATKFSFSSDLDSEVSAGIDSLFTGVVSTT